MKGSVSQTLRRGLMLTVSRQPWEAGFTVTKVLAFRENVKSLSHDLPKITLGQGAEPAWSSEPGLFLRGNPAVPPVSSEVLVFGDVFLLSPITGLCS